MENSEKLKDAAAPAKTGSESQQTATTDAPPKITLNINQADIERTKLEIDDIDFVEDSKAALVAKNAPLMTATLLIIGLLFLVGIIWATFSNLDEISQGVGKVVPFSQIQIIQNLEGGVLSNMHVKEGQIVQKGQILAQLDDTVFASQYRESYAKWVSLQATIARLVAQTEKKTSINFPPEVLKDQELVKHETDLFNSQLESVKEGLENLRHTYELAEEELNIVSPLVARGAISKVEVLRLQRELLSIKTRIDSYDNQVREQYFTDLNKAQENSNILAEGLTGLKDRMKRTTLFSPVYGVVKNIYLNTIGGVLKSGVPLMEVVPLNDQLIIEARVRPADIGFITIGQKAKVKITAYDYSVYGDLTGVVTNIGADTIMDERGNSYYEVTVKTDKNYLGKKNGKFPIIPGMTAIVDIITGKKSIMTYVLKPIIRAKEEAMRER